MQATEANVLWAWVYWSLASPQMYHNLGPITFLNWWLQTGQK